MSCHIIYVALVISLRHMMSYVYNLWSESTTRPSSFAVLHRDSFPLNAVQHKLPWSPREAQESQRKISKRKTEHWILSKVRPEGECYRGQPSEKTWNKNQEKTRRTTEKPWENHVPPGIFDGTSVVVTRQHRSTVLQTRAPPVRRRWTSSGVRRWWWSDRLPLESSPRMLLPAGYDC